MPNREPVTDVDARYSSPGARATPWPEALRQLAGAELYWLTSVRPDGRPHVTPLLGVWVADALWFCTGPHERKARNLATNPRCALTTGANALHRGLDLVVEGEAERVTDEHLLRQVAGLYEAKYGSGWRFTVREGAFHHAEQQGPAIVFRVTPVTAFGFRKGDYAQTRYRF